MRSRAVRTRSNRSCGKTSCRGCSHAVARRRTFAIVSHPDAGKTTLTEKFLLYGGAVQLAGSVTARKNQRATTSDWMELEKQARHLDQLDGAAVRLPRLPHQPAGHAGHKDFSEDTYRVLTAVDAAVMVIDAGKGIESQTRKLFEVCRQRGVPIFTFMNKLDRPARDPLACWTSWRACWASAPIPMNWPLGTGRTSRASGTAARGWPTSTSARPAAPTGRRWPPRPVDPVVRDRLRRRRRLPRRLRGSGDARRRRRRVRSDAVLAGRPRRSTSAAR
jgi:hypothetical protein